MQNTKELSQQNQYLVTRISLIDTVTNIPVGKTATFDCRVLGPMASAKSCVSRLNKAAGFEEYKIGTEDNGVTYSITHNKN